MPLNTGQLDNLIGHCLRHAFLTGQRAFLDVYPERNITPLAYGAFELIRLNPGVSHSAISKQLRVATSVLTTALKQHIKNGLIVQSTDQNDRRVVGYRLSVDGEVWFHAISDNILKAEANLSQGLTLEESDQLKALLKKLVLTATTNQVLR